MADEEQPDFMGFILGQPSPEAIKKMQDAHEHAHAVAVDFQHELEGIWQSLNGDQLNALAAWCNMMTRQPELDIRSQLAYLAGSLYRLAADRSDTCMVCDKNHDKDLSQLLETSDTPQKSGKLQEPSGPHKLLSDDEISAAEKAYTESQRIIREHEANLVIYGIEQDFENGGFKCVNCGTRSPSLEDRMLRPPKVEGCSGCQEKAKWG